MRHFFTVRCSSHRGPTHTCKPRAGSCSLHSSVRIMPADALMGRCCSSRASDLREVPPWLVVARSWEQSGPIGRRAEGGGRNHGSRTTPTMKPGARLARLLHHTPSGPQCSPCEHEASTPTPVLFRFCCCERRFAYTTCARVAPRPAGLRRTRRRTSIDPAGSTPQLRE